MNAAKGAFAFISIVLFGAAIHTYFQPRDDASSMAMPLILAAIGAIAAVIAANMDRLLKRGSRLAEGRDPGDVAMPSSSRTNEGGPDCDD